MQHKDSFRRSIGFILFLVILAVSLMILEPFITPIIAAAIIAIVFDPLYKNVISVFGRKRLMAFVFIILITGLVVAPLSIASYFAFMQGFAMFQGISQETSVVSVVSSRLDVLGINVGSSIGEAATAGADFILKNFTKIVGNVSYIVLGIIMFFISLYYFFKDGDRISAWFLHVLPFSKSENKELVDKFRESSYSMIYTSVLIALAQATSGGILFYLFGIKAAIFWAFVIFLLAFLPLVGPAIIWFPLAIFLGAQGNIAGAVGLGVLSFLIMWGIDISLRQKLMGKRLGIHPFVAFIGVIGGIILLGFVGIIIGPLVLHFSIEFSKVYVAR